MVAASVGEMVVRGEEPQSLSVFDRLPDPLAAVTRIGEIYFRSKAGGVKTQQEGELMALVCLCERKHVFEIGRTYHLMDGKLTMRADAMIAEFQRRGGKFKWIKTGDDGIEASLQLTRPDGDVVLSNFTIQDAKDQGLIRDGSRWAKGPKAIGSMLRARCASNGIRMADPGVNCGTYTPEEMEDEFPGGNGAATPPKRSKEEVAKRQQDLAATSSEATAATGTTAASAATNSTEAAIDVPFEARSVAATEDKPSAQEPASAATATAAEPTFSQATAVLMEIEALIGKAGLTKANLEASLKKANPNFTSLDSLSHEAASQLLKNLQAKLGK